MSLLIIVDYSHIYYRAFFSREAIPQHERVFSKDRRDITHIRRAYNMFSDNINDAIFEFDANDVAVAVCMDGDHSVKSAIYPEYKATRKHVLDAENYKDIASIGKAFLKRGASVYQKEGYEADDIVYSLIKDYGADFKKIIVYTGDSDLLMHAAPDVMVKILKNSEYRRVTAKRYVSDIEFLFKRHAVYNDTLLYKSLVGDTSDNIKGVKGFGAKAVIALDSCPVTYDGVLSAAASIGQNSEDIVRSLGMAFPLYIENLVVPAFVDAEKKFAKIQQVNVMFPELPDTIERALAPDFSHKRLSALGFAADEIRECAKIYQRGGKFTPSFLQRQGYSYDTCVRLRYLFEIACGKVEIDTKEDLKKHLRKLAGNRRVTIGDIGVSPVVEVPKLCLIGGIIDPVFGIYNSARYPIKERFYRVVKVSSQRVIVRTKRKPEITVHGAKEVEDTIKILMENPDNSIDIEVTRQFTRLCRRYVIIASMRRPEFHFGCLEIVTIDGGSCYVYAREVAPNKDLKYSITVERALGSGVLPNEIKQRVIKCASDVHRKLSGVMTEWEQATADFILMESAGDESVIEAEVVEISDEI